MKTLIVILAFALVTGCTNIVPKHYFMSKVAVERAAHQLINDGYDIDELAGYTLPASDCVVLGLVNCLPASMVADEIDRSMHTMITRNSKSFHNVGYTVHSEDILSTRYIQEWVRGVANKRKE